jgi:hypothetical protein
MPLNVEAVPRIINITLEKEMQSFMADASHMK